MIPVCPPMLLSNCPWNRRYIELCLPKIQPITLLIIPRNSFRYTLPDK
ncbi:unnamed protein product, partial [Adineta steineri]